MKIKILTAFLLLVLSWGCGDLTDEVVNSPNSKYNISDITAPNSVFFNESDSSIVATLKIDNPGVISQVWYNVVTANASETIINNVIMYDDGDKINYGDEEAGDKIYSGKTYLGKSKPSTQYLLKFYVKDNINNEDDNTRVVGFHQFDFDNGQNKVAPVLSELVMPDSIKRGVDFVFTIRVTDENTLADIKQVYFQFTRPDNSTSGTVVMADDGDAGHGDQTAGDGIYSFKNSFSDGSKNDPAQIGNYIFNFEAEDFSGLISNQISHTIVVLE
jgi:hypothetical protein